MDQKQQDRYYMRLALEEAARGRGFTNPNPMVGAVIVKDNEVIAKGYHHACGQGHAEVEAFRAAGDKDVTGATMYVTLEPCSHYGKTPPCADKIIEKGIGRVVVGALDPNPLVAGRGIEKLKNAGISVTTGVLAEESVQLYEIFMKYIVNKEPFVLYKSAMSLDGKIATPSGESQWISCEASRQEVHAFRHQYMGIMVGSETVLSDDPMLNCRLTEGEKRDPIRIVVDSKLRIPMESTLVRTAGEIRTIVACTQEASTEKEERLRACGVEILRIVAKNGHVDLKTLVLTLGQMQIDSILLEGGATLAGAAFEAGIVDKVCMYVAPMIIGGQSARTPVGGSGIAHLSDAWHLEKLDFSRSGEDICITGYVKKS